jgi:hypothetical protein
MTSVNQHMNSIGNKIQTSLLGSIIIVTVCALIMMFVNQINSYINRHIIDTMTMEYSIINLTQNLAQAYNNIFKNPGNTQFTAEYATLHTKLISTLTSLKKDISSKESALLFVGVENTVNKVVKECDAGLLEIRNNNFQNGLLKISICIHSLLPWEYSFPSLSLYQYIPGHSQKNSYPLSRTCHNLLKILRMENLMLRARNPQK